MLESKVDVFLNRHSFELNNKILLIGVSGGPDSLALLYYLYQEREKRNLTLIAAHVDHMFRGQESYEDALFVKDFCKEHQIIFEMARINVTEIMNVEGKSAQLAAREARYGFFSELMSKYQADCLVLGHHGDDQIETILMRLTRGSTAMARAGIPFSRPFGTGVIIRPFLCLTRNDIDDFCGMHRLTPRLDPSNEKGIYSRNRFRHELLPFLKKENPQVHDHFQRLSEELQADEAYLQELTIQNLNTVVKQRDQNKIIVDIKGFLGMPLPLQRRGIQLILNYLYTEKPASLAAVHIEQVFSLIHSSGPSGELHFPNNLKVIRSYCNLEFQLQPLEIQDYYFEINEPGTVYLPDDATITIAYASREERKPHDHTAFFNAEKVKWPLIIRTRITGDRMSIKGMKGSKKLKDIFIDQKIPLHERNRWPVITDRYGTILWLPGLKKSATEGQEIAATNFIQLTYKK